MPKNSQTQNSHESFYSAKIRMTSLTMFIRDVDNSQVGFNLVMAERYYSKSSYRSADFLPAKAFMRVMFARVLTVTWTRLLTCVVREYLAKLSNITENELHIF